MKKQTNNANNFKIKIEMCITIATRAPFDSFWKINIIKSNRNWQV